MNKRELNVFPCPRSVRFGKGTVSLNRAEWIVLPSPCSRALRQRVDALAARVSERLNQPIRVAATTPGQGTVLLEMRVDHRLSSGQAFELKLSQAQRSLRAGGEAGVFYGCLAFFQLIDQFGFAPPALTLNDAPDFASRGVMLDVSRCKVPTMATCKQLIDRLAGLRINQLQLYIEHTFAFSAHETVWHDASPFTHEEILELDQYGADRFVELVPNLNSFGHFERWLRHPEYRGLAECPDTAGCSTLAPNNASLRFLESLYDEYLPHFSSTLFNVGCDETWELGKGRSRASAAKTSTTAVYLQFLQKIHKLCTKKGRRMQFWGDIILHQPELVEKLPPDIVALNWGYEGNHPYAKRCPVFAEAGVESHVCPGTSSWNSLTGRTDNCLANLQNAARNGLKYGATGYLITDWGDGGHHQVLPISYAGFAAGAGYSWCLQSNRNADLAGAIGRHFFDESTAVLGRFCLDLGRTLNRLPGLSRGNCSAIHQLLFGKLSSGKLDLSGVSVPQYVAAGEWLDKLSLDLDQAHPQCVDKDLVMRELRHALAAGRHAIHRGRYFQYGHGSVRELRSEGQSLVRGHEDQWLARNRRGGLYESSTRLRKTTEEYDQS